MELKELIQEFIYDCEVRNLTKRTIKGYTNHLEYFNKYLKVLKVYKINELKHIHIKKFIKNQQDKGCKTSYINTTLKILTAFYKWLIREEYVSKHENPMDKIKLLKGNQTLIETFTDDEVKRMISVFKGYDYLTIRNKTIMAMLFDTGIRNFELCSLKNIMVKENYILIYGKGNKERIVPRSPYLNKVLFRYERIKDKHFECRTCDEEFYFVSRTGRQLTDASIERIVAEAGKKANINPNIRCSPHTCRHYFAQKQLLGGNDIYSVSKLLGHSNISITQTYIRSIKDDDIIKKSVSYSPLMNL